MQSTSTAKRGRIRFNTSTDVCRYPPCQAHTNSNFITHTNKDPTCPKFNHFIQLLIKDKEQFNNPTFTAAPYYEN